MTQNPGSVRTQNASFATSRKAAAFGLAVLATAAVSGFDSESALAWSQHYLITDHSLTHPAIDLDDSLRGLRKDSLESRVPVVAFDDFVAATAEKLPGLVDGYDDWLAKRGLKRFKHIGFHAPGTPGAAATPREAFLRAFRLNPSTTFPLVQRILPGGKPEFREIPATQVNSAVSPKPSFPAEDWVQRFDDVKGRQVTIRSILVTFSDEPDWGMDQGLWSIPEFGYGEPPYGARTGISSQAAFHMLFRQENWLTRIAVPELGEGMTIERIEAARRLSKFAFENGQPYWGLRFAAWGLHYVQDLTQPFHARSVPEAGYLWTLKYVFTADKAGLRKRTMQLVKNRHFLYEDLMAFALQQSSVERVPAYDGLSKALDSGIVAYPMETAADPNAFALQIVRRSAGHAESVDSAIVDALGPRMTQDPEYDLEVDRDFHIRKVIGDLVADSKRSDILFGAASEDHEDAGRATRGWLRAILPASARRN